MNVQNVYHQIYKDRFEEKSKKKLEFVHSLLLQ